MLNLKELLGRDNVMVEIKADTKEGVITEMVDHLAALGKIKDRDAALKAVLEREARMSTGMQNGIAIPHSRSDLFEDFVVALGTRSQGVDFQSIDGQPAFIFIMTLSPANRPGPHIQFLSEMSRRLEDEDVRRKVIEAREPTQVLRALGVR